MTDLQILTAVKDHHGLQYTELLNLGLSCPNHDPIADNAQIEKLIQDKYLAGRAEAYCTVRLTNKGRLYLQQLQQELDKQCRQAAEKAEEKRHQYRHDWLIAIFSTIFGAILGTLGTLLVQWLNLL